ncbi:MAG: glycosyltransferase [Nitrospirota bacterium]
MQPINILHVIPKLSVGGVENQLALVLRKYDRTKFCPFVCCLSDKDTIGKEIETNGIEVVYLNRLKHKFDWKIVKDIYKLIQLWNIKIVRTHQYHANLYGRLAAWLARVPCIVASVHNVYTIDKKIHRRIINKCFAGFTDKIIAVSNAVKRDIIRYDRVPEDKIMVIYNGKEIDSFLNIKENIRTELGISPEIPVIGTVGRLTPQKGQKYLIEAISKLKNKFPGMVLLIAGDGPLKQKLEKYSEMLGLSEDIKFLGTRRDIPAILSAMDIFVLPSIWEGLCNALIEAMAAGKPIIATDIQPNKEIISSERLGMLIPPENSDAIASSIELLLNNKGIAENMRELSRKKVALDYNINTSIQKYESLFEEILKGKGWSANRLSLNL